jgi:predicted kinase
MLIIFGGLPATGKTTLSRALARALSAVHVRIDTIEQAIAAVTGAPVVDETGYRVGYAVAEDNLRLGRIVIADSVNPLQITREAWRAAAARSGVAATEIEVICSDAAEHRRRVEMRDTDIAAARQLTWQDVATRDYEPWDRAHVVIDTAGRSIEDCCAQVRAALTSMTPHAAGLRPSP